VILADAGPGRTTVADRVIEKIAAQAARDVAVGTNPAGPPGSPGSLPLPGPPGSGRLPGSSPGASAADLRPLRRRPKVGVKIDGRLAWLSMSVALRYPTPVRQVAGAIRAQVIWTVGELVGLDVREVDVEVAALVRDPAPAVERAT
jgi:uncharacterized alkaline shock family protein YloU